MALQEKSEITKIIAIQHKGGTKPCVENFLTIHPQVSKMVNFMVAVQKEWINYN